MHALSKKELASHYLKEDARNQELLIK